MASAVIVTIFTGNPVLRRLSHFASLENRKREVGESSYPREARGASFPLVDSARMSA
jgi:hypothetical protein